jgi:uridine phosphorylase
VRRFFDPTRVVLDPRAIAGALTRKEPHELALPERAIITFNEADLRRLTEDRGASVLDAWAPFRMIRLLSGTSTVVVRSSFGGPNIAVLMEELSAFGVGEFLLWGYCGGMGPDRAVGDVCLAGSALREEGISWHYLEDESDMVSSRWADDWTDTAAGAGFPVVDIWTTDALYRETENKIEACIERGISAVEMEVASFYAVATAKGLKAVAFLVVSDLFNNNGTWTSGFHTRAFREGVKKLARFMKEKAVL